MDAIQGNGDGGGIGRVGKARVTKAGRRNETADRVANYKIDYVGGTCLSMLHVLLQLARLFFFGLRFPCPFVSLLIVFCLSCCIFCLSHLLRGRHHTSFELYIDTFFNCFFAPFVLLSVIALSPLLFEL